MRTSASGWVRTLWRLAEHYSLEPELLFQQAGLDASQRDNPYYRYLQDHITRFWTLIVEATGKPDIGLAFGQQVNVTTFNAIGYVMLSSSTLGDALNYGLRYQRYLSEATCSELIVRDGAVHLSLTNLGDQMVACEQSIEAALSAFIYFVRWVSQSSFSPQHLYLAHAPTTALADYETLFACPVTLNAQITTLVLPAEQLAKPLISRDPAMHAHHLQLAEEQSRSRHRPTVLQLKVILDSLVPLGRANIETVSRLMHCSGKTLQRRLLSENTSFKAELESYGYDLACKYLKQGHLDLTEVALLCGYADYSAFAKAFRRWSGLSPSVWRRSQRA